MWWYKVNPSWSLARASIREGGFCERTAIRHLTDSGTMGGDLPRKASAMARRLGVVGLEGDMKWSYGL